MLLSIITVSYNSAETIRRCIASVVPQLMDEIEYIVYDGKSTDGTHQVLSEYEERQQIKWIRCMDAGIYDAMNKAVAEALGKYVCFVNSDDYLEKNALSTFVHNIKTSENADLLVHGSFIVTDGTRVKRPIVSRWPIWLKMPYDHQATLVKKTFFVNSGGYSLKYGLISDYEFFLRNVKRASIKLHTQYTNNLVRGGRSDFSKSAQHLNLALIDNGFNICIRALALAARKAIQLINVWRGLL